MAAVAVLSPSWGLRLPIPQTARAPLTHRICAVEAAAQSPVVASRHCCPRPRSGAPGCRTRGGTGCRSRLPIKPCAAISQLVLQTPTPQVTTTRIKVPATPPTTARAVATPALAFPSGGSLTSRAAPTPGPSVEVKVPATPPATARAVATGPAVLATSATVAALAAAVAAPAAAAARSPSRTPVPSGVSEAAPPPLSSIGPMPVSFGSRAPPGQTAKRVLCYGDSLTAGFCAEGRQYEPYGRALAEALSAVGVACEVSVCGHSGHTTAQMVANLDELAVSDVGGMIGKGLRRCLDEIRPDLVVIMTGTNDLGKNAGPQTVCEDISRLHAVCHSRGVPTVALAPPPAPMAPQGSSFERRRRQLVSLMDRWSRTAACTLTFVDPGDLVPAQAGPGNRIWDADKLHLSPNGSRVLARKMAALLAPLPALNAAAGGLARAAAQAAAAGGLAKAAALLSPKAFHTFPHRHQFA